ncbi:MAG: DUF1573 domain-containing protein [Deltaproteobacteria bacterium]|nr:DUF1573 domain-containing protein [Deltaproteobacteria bacterium]
MQMIKKSIMCIGLALLILVPLRAWPGANLVLSETRVDFGNMVEGVVAEKVIKLFNAGDQPLKITNVTTS